MVRLKEIASNLSNEPGWMDRRAVTNLRATSFVVQKNRELVESYDHPIET